MPNRFNNKLFASVFVYSIVFEGISAPVMGFYAVPTILAYVFFIFLPFTLPAINIFLSWLFGFLVLESFAIYLNNWVSVSYKLYLHGALYFFIFAALLYLFYEKD